MGSCPEPERTFFSEASVRPAETLFVESLETAAAGDAVDALPTGTSLISESKSEIHSSIRTRSILRPHEKPKLLQGSRVDNKHGTALLTMVPIPFQMFTFAQAIKRLGNL